MKQKLKKISFWILVFLVVFFVGGYFAFNSDFVQAKLTNYLSSYLSDKWGTEVSVNNIRLDIFQQVQIEGLYIEDQHQDTLLYAKELYVDFSKLRLLKLKFVLKNVKVDDLKFYLKRYEGEESLNLQFILDSLGTDTTQKESKPFKLDVDELELIGVHFIFHDMNVIDTSYGMQYKNLDIYDINGLFYDVKIIDDSIRFDSYHFSAKDKSGLRLDNLQAKGYVSGKGMDLKPVYIKMNNSVVDANRLAFKYNQWADYKDFNESVKMFADIKNARILMNDIAFFAGNLEGWKQEFILSGTIKGKVSNLSGKSISLKTGNETSFNGDFNLDGLPNIQNTFMTILAKDLVTSGVDIENIQTIPYKENKYLESPDGIKAMGKIRFNGEFTGFINDFVAYGTFNTDKGKIISDVSLKNTKNDTIVVTGNFTSEKLRLDALLGNETFGVLNSRLSINIKTSNNGFESAHLAGLIYRMDFNNYNYRNINLDGVVKPNNFNGSLTVDDPALQLDFTGKVEITDDIKDLDFNAELYYADLGALNFLPIDKYSSLSGSFKWRAYGYEYDELIGTFEIGELSYCTDESDFNFGNIYLETDTIASVKSINLISDELDILLNGKYRLSNIIDDFKWQVNKVMPALFAADSNYVPLQSFEYDVTFKDMKFLRELGILEIDIKPGTYLHGIFNPSGNITNFNFYSDGITIGDIEIHYPEAFFDLSNKDIYLEILVDGLAFKQSETRLDNSSIIFVAKQDTIITNVNWKRSDERFGSGVVNTTVNSLMSYRINFNDFKFSILEKVWNLDNSATIVVDSNYFGFNDIELATTDQSISFSGELSSDEYDTLNIDVNNFNLENFNYILNQLDYSIAGVSNGNVSWIEHEGNFKLESNLQIDSTIINDYYLGDIMLSSLKHKNDTAYNFEMSLLNNSFEKLHIDGKFYAETESDEKIDFNVRFDDFNLNIINSLKITGISKVAGIGNGVVNISGSFKNPVLNGKLKINDGGVTIDAIGSHLIFDTEVDFEKDYIGLDPFFIHDSKGNKGLAYGTILHDHFKDWNFNLDVEMENFESLNLTKSIDAIYYGKAYATGTFNISGYSDLLFITVDAKTMPNTKIYIPLDGANTIKKQELVTFVSHDPNIVTVSEEFEKLKSVNGITLALNITVSPDADVFLVFDEITGDVLHVRADGLISLGLNKEGDFKMKGTLEVKSGEYFFSMEGIINKQFEIQPGSRITWFGDPYDADIDISATYYTRAALYPIMTFDQESYRNRVNVELILMLKGKLTTPAIQFNILLPESKERERTSLKNATVTTQDMNLQVVSLLLFGSFQPINGANQSENFAAVSTYEMLSNQVSNILSSVSDDFDINFSYRPETTTSGQEVSVGVSTQFLNDRLLVSTDFGVRDNSYYGADDNVNSIIGDFVAEYKLTEDGKIRLKAYNRSNDYQSTTVLKQAPYTQGFGLVYRKDFDRFLKGNTPDWDELQKKYNKEVAKENAKELERKNKEKSKKNKNKAKKEQDKREKKIEKKFQ
jgi:ribosome-associated toxin RatA of RatAB toxin-antitoxin module